MKWCLFTLITYLLMFNNNGLSAQKVVNVSYPSDGEVILAEGIAIPKIASGYTLWLPRVQNVKGMIIFFQSRRDEKKKENIIRIAAKNDLAIMYATTENPMEFLFEEVKMKDLATFIMKACDNFMIPKNKLLYTGTSIAGTRALKMAIFTSQEEEFRSIVPVAISVCDSPLDMSRFYYSSKKEVEINFESISASEDQWASSYLEANLDGNPSQNQARYIQYSPYSRTVRNGGNAPYFTNIHFRAYTEPDVQWWIENRRKDYYGMNAYDLAGFVNQLLLLGGSKAELITTKNKGKRAEGSKNPYSWSIVDEKEMVDWFLDIISE